MTRRIAWGLLTSALWGAMSISCGATRPSLPTAVSITVTPATPSIAGVTQVAFQANAQGTVDPSLSYTWDFGDRKSVV